MTTQPSLPAVIGATENALRELLLTTLASTEIASYSEWVVLNAVSAAGTDAPSGQWRNETARALKTAVRPIEAALRERGLIVGETQLSDSGVEALAAARRGVGTATASLIEGMNEADVAATRRVLATVRDRAEALVAAQAANDR